MPSHYIGLMSGTSLDGVDGVLMAFPASEPARVIADCSLPIPSDLRAELLALNRPGPNELHRAAVAGHQLAGLYASAVAELLQSSQIPASSIKAIGAHGQTVRHSPPGAGNPAPYTWQLNQPAVLAEQSGITVVADFRSRDIAAGGQGAPLVPAFHRQVFGRSGESVAVVNIGGIANITALPADGRVLGLDTGPGNVLMDLWCQRHTGQPYDADGAWAATGTPHNALLNSFLSEPYFARGGIKSTGRDLFHADWLDEHVKRFPTVSPQDVQATLLQLTAITIARAVKQTHWGDDAPPRVLIACGGGALNAQLLRELSRQLPALNVATSATYGWPVSQVEAAAFAWLAKQTMEGKPGNEPQATGAKGHRVLGAIYPG
jgi:anhydro-N-acetylmuramic acid kinase